MIILLAEGHSPEFISFDELVSISDEITLESACQFILHFYRYDLRCYASSSTDYVEWMQKLDLAMDLYKKQHLKHGVEKQDSKYE
jgi:hypothetical protein